MKNTSYKDPKILKDYIAPTKYQHHTIFVFDKKILSVKNIKAFIDVKWKTSKIF